MAQVTEEMMAEEIVQHTNNENEEENVAEEALENKQVEEEEQEEQENDPLDSYGEWYDNLGYDPAKSCWRCTDGDGKEIEPTGDCLLFNIPKLQYAYHFEGIINDDTLITYDANDASDDAPCDPDSKISDVAAVWRLVKWPPQTWEVITDDLNAWIQFEEMDANSDNIVSEAECEAFWKKKKLKPEVIEQKLKELKECDKDGDGKIYFEEFKTRFNGPNEKFLNDDFKIRLARWSFVILLPILGLIILIIFPDVPIAVLIGISIQFMYMIYFGTLGYYFVKGSNVKDDAGNTNYLYRVFSRPGKAVIFEGNWAPLSMTLNQVAWPLKCVHSVSEFSAVDGAIPSIMLSNIGQYTWAMVTMHFMIQILLYEDFEWKFADILELFGVAGLVMLGVFEADPYNPSVNKFHMVGALCGFGTVIGYIVQQLEARGVNEEEQGSRTTLAWLLAILFIVFYTMWNVVLSMSFFEEANAWGMYDDLGDDDDEEVIDDDDDECSCLWVTVIVVVICCICSGFPLLIFIMIYGPYKLYVAYKHKKRIKERGPKHYQKYVFDFQPALPDWGDYVTPAIKKRISAFSIANVMFEGIVLLVGSTALSLYLMSYERQCEGVCADQIFMILFLITTAIVGVIGSYGLLLGGDKFGGGLLDC